MKLLIYIEQSKILENMLLPAQVNPGFGGTTYSAIRLAFELHQKYQLEESDIKVSLITKNFDEKNFNGMEVINFNQLENYFCDIFLISGDIFDFLLKQNIRLNTKRLIAWIHHPFDYDKINKSKKLNAEIVSVGKSQFISNYFIAGNHNHIENLFCARRIRKSAIFDKLINQNKKNRLNDFKNNITFGYMGALVPSKGFHQIARYWRDILDLCYARDLQPRLEVIGGTNLYGFDENHSKIPTTLEYGNLIEKMIGKEIDSTVFFHGTLDQKRYKLMSRCDIAIVNPEGYGEAFPASILEWMSLSIPVIGSQNYGCYDAMRFNYPLTIKSNKEIVKKIKFFLNLNTLEKENLKDLSYNIANYFSSKQEYIVNKWILLFKQQFQKINEYPSKIIVIKLLYDWLKYVFKKIFKKLFLMKIKNK
ncbi:CpsL [Prochlorococcus marinus str. MIT 9321]|uniref:CpsL n=1 Tax=Prochlorococcus marinus str. MIT 9401 TaxID=167551 RepID=A0A0A2BCT2_PROMR|nr:glycosyltransferase [Prochlorococcus marinus]KGG02878.1 CpsL [Prochlorococcus marinus str. MIT 9321]KGG05501.1 CpsL [Prochlorococcus marinus str. MIT 9322]KGG10535.1 CpsL [Prochlorococcus marinus str. MIT 9401]